MKNRIPGGLIDNTTEFFTIMQGGLAVPVAIHNGQLSAIHNLPKSILNTLHIELKSKPVVEAAIEAMVGCDDMQKVAKFIMCRYGALNDEPDLDSMGRLSEPEYVPCQNRGKCDHEGKACCSIMVKEGIYLSKSETQVFKLVRLPDKLIADMLYISIETVKTHWQNIRRKTGLASKVEIAIYASQKNII